ncbi:MAG: carbohydrate binding domain-containing protein [Melioribacteraceae bacterium]|nr:carbohydrate binding domain-containing protein [Melioribacteraceae bacterium]
MNRKIIFLSALMLLLTFCTKSENPTETSTDSSVKGFLKIQNQPLTNAEVQIDDVLNWKTTTNEEGYFEIKNVTKGEHFLQSTKIKENGQLVSIKSTISVNEGLTDLGEIRLPEPPELYEIDTTEIAQNKLKLSWSRSLDTEFREYKLYRKDDAGIDETTGELIFVSTENEDTSFVDDSFEMGLEYFYRVYTLSAFGKLGGSNIMSKATPQPSIVQNGDFEKPLENQAIQDWASNVDIFTLDSTTVYNGMYSLKANKQPEAMNDYNLNQDIPASKFIEGRTYKFSVKMKSENTPMGAYIFYDKNGMNLITTVLQHPEGADWGELTTEFQIPNDASVITIRLWIQKEDSYNDELTGWFDDVVIELQ